MRRVAQATGATVLLAILLLGVPWALLHWGRLADLATVDWGGALSRPDDGRVILGVLSLSGWLAWGMLALTTIGELLHAVSRGRISFHMPGTGWLRPVVALLVAAALSPLLAANASPSLTDAPVAVAAPAEARPTEPTDAVSRTAPREPVAWREYEVQPGDELWDIAARELGAGERWRQLVAANPGIDVDHPPPPGTILRLPMTVTVESGDSLWHLAERHLGDPERWPELHEANRDRITDPDEIDAGWVLTLPGTDVAESSTRLHPTPPAVTNETIPPPVSSPEETAPPSPTPHPRRPRPIPPARWSRPHPRRSTPIFPTTSGRSEAYWPPGSSPDCHCGGETPCTHVPSGSVPAPSRFPWNVSGPLWGDVARNTDSTTRPIRPPRPFSWAGVGRKRSGSLSRRAVVSGSAATSRKSWGWLPAPGPVCCARSGRPRST
ncbi:LysM peptidoglycan-binding domain-containing protein [[Pseudopropionibacterium] massiliense]|uniref:LysM peptidoglycan-binding domain-containing protein n=1 Tax=[Pseudopropionibacterium] massiliense TaxID=2220000 RepID=UPI001031A574|nr:LysM peptidoglycan-binding domain-containing protein [[Pseudopropionibacterium] massiliense]